MSIEVFFTPLGLKPADVAGKPVLVIDVLRATTTMIAALAHGARGIVPAASPDEAIRMAQGLAPDGVLLAGERGCRPIERFHLGNSPREMTADVVAGQTIVMATTNGTPALVAAEGGRPVMVAAVTNFSAAVERARAAFEAGGEIVILCSGREKRFALEDAYVAGRMVRALTPDSRRRETGLDDAAIAALQLVRRYGDRWKRAVRASAAARHLTELGYQEDVAAATEMDTHSLVPIYAERRVTGLAPARVS